MSNDRDRPESDRFGPRPEEQPEGALLFEPGLPADPDDDDYLPPEPEGRSPTVAILAAGALIVLAVFIGMPFFGGSEEVETPPEAVTIVSPAPVDTISRAALTPIPSSTVAGPIGSQVRIAVRATGRSGSALRNGTVRFTIVNGRGELTDSIVDTGADGIAVAFLQLPPVPGRTAVTAEVLDQELDPVAITAVAEPGPPSRMAIAGGNGQEAEVGRLLPERVYVAVRDSMGNPVPGTIVRFRIGSGDGIFAARSETDTLGRASALWRLGPVEGEQTLIASISSISEDLVFTATATPPATLEIAAQRPSATSPVSVVARPFSVGGSHVCSIQGQSLRCRGTNERGQSEPSGDLGFVSVAAGSSHTCAIAPSGVASCWGANDAGQLGDGSREDRSSPVRIRTELRFSILAAGAAHTCGLAGGGTPLCWGENVSGQVGDGTRNDQTVPSVVGGGVAFEEIVAGWSHTCGRSASGNTFCWGQNNRGQLGDGTLLDRLQPELVRQPSSGLVAGSAHTCGIRGSDVICWGSNEFGQLGDGTTDDRSEPTVVRGLPGRPLQLAAGAVHTCAVVSDNRAYCWGQNRQGQLGNGTMESSPTPVAVAGNERFESIHAGGGLTCGFTRDGAQYCWGLNLSGQIGDGSRTNRSVPTRVGG